MAVRQQGKNTREADKMASGCRNERAACPCSFSSEPPTQHLATSIADIRLLWIDPRPTLERGLKAARARRDISSLLPGVVDSPTEGGRWQEQHRTEGGYRKHVSGRSI